MEYGLIGEHLGHSFSAEIHGKLFGYDYQLRELRPDEVEDFFKKRDFKAINVTIPYKQVIIPFLDEVDPTAMEIGAVNTVVNKDGKLFGYNTDFSGMKALIEKNGMELAGTKVVILGSGGTSHTAQAVAKSLGACEIYRVSRSGRDGCITYEEAYDKHTDASFIINTTPVGMFPKIGALPVELDRFTELKGVVDAVYNPLRTALIQSALDKGIKAAGGLYMLVSQAVFAAERFVDKKVDPSRTDEIFAELYSSKKNLVMIGMPGCGKTTIGKGVAQRLGMDLIDTDAEILKRIDCSIAEFFAKNGEEAFRDIESQVIKEVSALQHTVISTGGGAILRSENVSLLKENGTLLFLDRPFEFLVTSLDRPLSSDRDMLKKRYEERYDIYCSCADIRLSTSQEKTENIERAITEFMK